MKCQYCGTSYETNCNCGKNVKYTAAECKKMFAKDCELISCRMQEAFEQWVIDNDPEINRKANVIWELSIMISRMSR